MPRPKRWADLVPGLAALAVLGLGVATHHRRHVLAGLFLGAAAGLKLVPLLLVPALLRRGRWRTPLTAAGLLAAGYLPHVVVAGGLVVGFLPGYLVEEGYGSGGRFALLSWLPESWRPVAAATVALTIAVLAVIRSPREPVPVTLCWLYGSALLVATPVYPWYALPFVVVVLLAGRLEWLAVWAAAYLAFVFDEVAGVQAAGYSAALLAVVAVGWWRARRPIESGPSPVPKKVVHAPVRSES